MLFPKKSKRRTLFVFFFVAVVLSFMIGLFFIQYRKSLEREVNELVLANLDAYTQSQKNEVLARIDDVQGTIEALALLVNSSRVGPDSEWLSQYLDNLSEYHENYDITSFAFSSISDVDEIVSKEDIPVVNRLLNGEKVISDVYFSERLGYKYYFSVAIPMEKEGRVVGALQSLLEASLLVQTSQGGFLRESIVSHIVKRDGTLVPLDTETTSLGVSVSDAVLAGATPSMCRKIQAALQTSDSGSYIVPVGGKDVFVSFAALGYNDWCIFNYSKSSDLSSHSQIIIRNTLWVSGTFIVLVLVAVFIVFWYIRRQWYKMFVDQERYSMLSHFSDTVLFEYSIKDDSLVFTDNVREMLPLDKLRIPHVTNPEHTFSPLAPESKETMLSIVRHVSDIKGIQSLELQFLLRDGQSLWCECVYQVVYDDRKQPVLIIGKLVDVSNRKKQIEELQRESRIDGLTGLYNKDTEEKLVKSALPMSKSGYLLMIDVDNFKALNDRFGHHIGDSILKRLGKVLRDTFNGFDAIAGRVGGDEFLIYIAGISKDKVTEKADHILSAASDFCIDQKNTVHISTSIGIAAYPADGVSYDFLYVAADTAMYQAKRAGKNTFRFYEPSFG